MTEEYAGRIQYSSSLAGRWENALSLMLAQDILLKKEPHREIVLGELS